MKLLNKFITESLKENKLDAIKFIEEYFDKFNSNKKNFMTNKFDSTEYDFSWTIESLLNCDDIQDNFACKRLLYKINKNYKGNKILPNTNGTTYTTISIKYLKRNLKNMCGAYKFNNINKREKTPALILPYIPLSKLSISVYHSLLP